MIKIITEDGISLDLAPDAEFAIEYNNPMFEDDRIPVPFSTSIALLPSEVNCRILQYLPAMKLEPAVKKLAASLVLNGIPFLSGILIYDGIEDDRLNYSFSGVDLETNWGKKIWKLDIWGPMIGYEIFEAFAEPNEGISWPLLVNKDYTGYYVKNCDDIALDEEYNKKLPMVEKNVKYHNFRNVIPEAERSRLTPAVSISKIIGDKFSVSGFLTSLFPLVSVIGQYNIEKGFVQKTKVPTPIDCAACLPDYSFAEFAAELSKMFCSAIFEDGQGKFKMVPINTILEKAASEDWTEKISDSFTSDTEEASGYIFGFANSGEDSFDDTAELVDANSLKASIYPSTDATSDSNLYTREVHTAKVAKDGSYVSAISVVTKSKIRNNGSPDVIKKTLVASTDVVFCGNVNQENIVDGSDSVDNSCKFKLIKSIPSILSHYDRATVSDSNKVIEGLVQRFSMAGLIESQNGEAERGTDLYIGLIYKGQISCNGYVLASVVPLSFPSLDAINNFEDIQVKVPVGGGRPGRSIPVSLKPDWIYETFHKSYAQWLATDRQVITCDVNLNEFDLLSFRMYNKVRLHGRDFFVKKLSVTLRAGSEALECSADFISA